MPPADRLTGNLLLLGLARLRLHGGDDTAALVLCDQAARLRPDDRMVQELRGPDRAEQGFRAAIQRKPDYAEAWLWLGRLLVDQDQPKEAESCFRRVIGFRPPCRPDTRRWENCCWRRGGRSQR